MEYIDFLKSKIEVAPDKGIEFKPQDVNPLLKPHERDSVLWMTRGGQRALFSSFGLGKSITQLESMRLILSRVDGKALIVCPLNVVDEFKADAMFQGPLWEESARQLNLNIDEIRFNYGVSLKYVKTQAEVEKASERILITNYERVRDGDIRPEYFTATSLDEASVLRSYGSKTYQEFLTKFRSVPFKFVATATPSPNKYKELIHYAGYLGIMDTGQALTRFFHRDSTQANNLTLYAHKEKEFWFWLSTWALFITRPSDMSQDYSDEGYAMPAMDIIYHEVEVDHTTAGVEDDGQVKLIRDAALGLKDAAKEKRDSIPSRVAKMMEIVNASPDDHFILWHDLEDERRAIKRALPEAVEVYGSQEYELNAEKTRDFKEGRFKYLATKPDISGQGGNLQKHCHKCIFVGIGYKFNDFIQAIHRIYRFGQAHKVEIHIIYAESEQAILEALKRKWEQHNTLVAEMIKIIRENGLASTNIVEKLARTIHMARDEVKGRRFTAIFNDNCLELPNMADDSVDLIHTSIPFSNHYEYTPTYNDFGHNSDNDRFFEQMDYLTPQLLRILKPGRICAVHVKDRILFGNATGYGMPTVDPFHMETTFHFMRHGFKFMGMITVVTDVVRENAQTYRLGWTENSKDGSKMGVGCEEYILIFRKLPTDTSTAYADEPVVKPKEEYTRAHWQIDAHGYWRSSGNRLLTPAELREVPVSELQKCYREFSRETVYDYREHVKLAEDLEAEGKLPSSFMVVAPGSHAEWVWDDVNRMRTLNGEQARKELTMHICPLQFDIVERIIDRYSMPGEVVFDPFAGLFTVPYCAVKMGRIGIGTELNPESFRDGMKYLKAADAEYGAPTLFDFM
ncbi:MAG: DNA methylase N-4 [Alphaproteobacteria bacterium]|nr:DNA methylase N-4 [Alphaproteobacteria bacterium]